MFRRHRRSKNGRMTPDASLAQAEAERRAQERKHERAQAAVARLERAAEENDIAARFREALSRGGH